MSRSQETCCETNETLLEISHLSLGLSWEANGFFLFDRLKKMGTADRLYKLYLGDSLPMIPISLILDKVKLFVGDVNFFYIG